MLNKIVNYYRTHRRIIKKDLRTNYTRPMKNVLHNYKIQLIRQFLDFKSSFFQLKNLRLVGIFVIMFWLFRDFAFAADEPQKAVDGAVDLLNGVIFIITLITQPLVMLIGWLLSPDWTFGDIFGLRVVIHDIWIIVSNIVYFIFAIMLIVIALMNIFSESKSFALKSALPRLVVGILIVPFTWFIVSATLSVGNVLTASVLSFSSDSIKKIDPSDKSILNAKIIPKTILIDLTENSDWTGSTDDAKKQMRKDNTKQIVCKEDGTSGDCISLVQMVSGANGAYNLMTYYAYGIFKIDTLKNVGQQQAGKSIKTIGDVFKKLTFSVIFALIFAILVIAIAFALITRMAMMWIYAMFSPLFALSYFLGGKGPKGLEKIEKKLSFKTFISLALVPTYVAAALSFGLIFLSYAMNSEYKGSSFITLSNSGQTDSNGDQSIKFGQGKGEVELKIIGKYTEGKTTSGVFGNTFAAGQGIISNVIISFLALIILWMAVMAALGASEITEKAVKPIAEFGDSIGKLMVDAPKYIPLKIPGLSKDGKSISLSLASLDPLRSQIDSHFRDPARAQATQFANATGLGATGANNVIDEFRGTHKLVDTKNGATTKNFVNTVASQESIKSVMESPQLRDKFLDGLAFYLGIKNIDDFKKHSGNHVGKLADALNKFGGETAKNAFGTDTDQILKSLEGAGKSSNPNDTKPKPTLVKDSIKKDGTGTKIEINVKGKDNKDNPIVLSMTKVNNIDTIKRADLEKALKDKGVEDPELLTSILDELKKDTHKVNVS